MKIQEMKTDELIPYVNNARHNDNAVDAVASSIKNFGFKVPVIVDSRNEIITGHTRIKAAKKLGMETVPVIVADDLTPEQVKAFRLADNKVGEIATWDDELLNAELAELGLDFDMTEFGFEPIPEADPEQDSDFDIDETIDEVTQNPISKPGQVWQLGDHRLMVGDSTNADDVAKLMGGEQLDLLVTDPPYNVAYVGKTEDALTIGNDSMESAAFRAFLTDAFKAADGVMKPGAAFYVWYASREHINFESAMVNVGWEVRQQLIWVKNVFVLGRQDYQWAHEPALYGWKGGAPHYFINDRTNRTVQFAGDLDPEEMTKDELLDYVDALRAAVGESTTLYEDKPARNGEHPTMKPVPLFGRLIANSSKPGQNVGDFFGGSGTTIIAAEQLGRHAFVMELDPTYADVIIRRWEEFTGEKAELIK